MNNLGRWFPWIGLVLALLGLTATAWPRSDAPEALHLYAFGRLPVLHDGRVKPLDSFARQSLMVISGRKETFGEPRGPQQPAIRWLLDVLASPVGGDTAWKHKVIRVENLEVLKAFGLEARPLFYRYAPQEFAGKMEILQREAERARELKEAEKPLDLYDTKILDLEEHLRLYVSLAQGQGPTVVAPVGIHKDWQSIADVIEDVRHSGGNDPAARAFLTMLAAHAGGKTAEFNRALAVYQEMVERTLPEEAADARFETWFNQAGLFDYCYWVYWVAVILGCIAWLGWEMPLNRTAFLLSALAVTVHTAALITRMLIQGKPPVTNLYSTAIFIGWGCVLLGLILEWIYLNGIGSIAGALIAALTLHLAPILGGTSDTLGNLVAVLNTQFWLATHVTIINIGYAATLMAGILGCLYILRGLLSKSFDQPARKNVGRMIYGINCFALFCSFTGTVLGGIWADQSWGRFWGWDPKENGALLIVLINAIVLHARWCGWAQERGMALISIVGNFIVAWSWFGTNQLGVGLHAYGFSDQLTWILRFFWASQVVMLLIGGIPVEYWRSYTARPQPRPQRR